MTDYEGRYITYDCGDNFGDALFIPRCPTCGRFVKPDETTPFRSGPFDQYEFGLNATCKRCGRVKMPFEGWF